MELHYRHFSIEMVNKQEKRKECLLTAETDYAILHDTDTKRYYSHHYLLGGYY